jgi:DNA-binding HxlR family transcriptional regulator/ubiquinone/menaquinone biosynthesis C-methylase UbiE
MPSSTSALKLLDLIQSHRVTAVIYVAAKLGIAELLCNGPKSLNELAKATGADQHALRRLLTALSTVGICSRVGDDRYALTKIGAALDEAADYSFKGWAIFEGEMLSKSWNGMLESIMTGKTAAQLLGLSNSFDLMSRTPENVRIFNAAMVDLTRLVTPDILFAYDFGRISHLMDVGGGSGELIAAVAKAYPRLRGTVFDLPRCAETANDHLQSVGVGDRASFLAGDFFKTIPAIADAIILKSVIHDWNDERSSVILQNCRQALPKSGTLLLVERIMQESPTVKDEDKANAMSDLNMLRGPGGLERTEKEYRQLLNENGFRPVSIDPAGRFSLIEARVV